ncbi:hypothetical protein ACF0H5_013594 [Mactra antiquata]
MPHQWDEDKNTSISDEVQYLESEANPQDLSSYFEDMSLELLDRTAASQTDPCIIFDSPHSEDEHYDSIDTIIQKIPEVIDYLHSERQIEMYTKFTTLLAERKFPLTNIAYLLFCDVVEWFSLDSTRTMRYSEDVKLFRNTGLKLFKGLLRSCLEESSMFAKVSDLKPCILDDMIKLINDFDKNKTKTYKLCVDGKKINAGFTKQIYGDVNPWGLEGPPNLEQNEERLKFDREEIFMHTSKAKVYDFHELMETVEQQSTASCYMTPAFVSQISPRNHHFDYYFRAKRKHGNRKSGEIAQPVISCKRAQPV